jgi:hypothetical protein
VSISAATAEPAINAQEIATKLRKVRDIYFSIKKLYSIKIEGEYILHKNNAAAEIEL